MGMEIQQIADSVLGNQQYMRDDNLKTVTQYADGTTRMVSTKLATIARTDTSAKNLFILPINAQIVDVTIWVGTASNAGTTATVSVGKTGNNTFFINGQDVKGTSGKIRPTGPSNLFTALSTSATTQIVGIYAETGAASNTGGPFVVQVDFVVPESGTTTF